MCSSSVIREARVEDGETKRKLLVQHPSVRSYEIECKLWDMAPTIVKSGR